MRSIKYIIPAILLTILTGCTKTGADNPVRDDVTVHWAISPGGLGDMGYNDIIFGGISAAASRYDFGLYYYRPGSAEEIYPTVKQWLSEPQAEGTRSLFVLGASDYEVTVRELMSGGAFPLPEGKDMLMIEYFADDLPVHTIGLVAMSAAYLAGCVADSIDRTPAVIAATLSDPQSLAAAAMTASCNKDTENTGLTVDAEAINCPLSGGTYDINLTSGKPCKALYCAEWLTVTPESGTGDATVTVGTDAWANEDSEESRLASVYFTDNTDTVAVLIGQINDDNISVPEKEHFSRYVYIIADCNTLHFPVYGGSYTINVDSYSRWMIKCDADWISFSPASGPNGYGSFIATVQEWSNPGNEESRTTTVRVASGSVGTDIDITQFNEGSIVPGPNSNR